MNEIRFNPLNNKKIIFCPDRMKRPSDIKVIPIKEKKRKCPFCPGNESMTPNEVFRLGNKKWKTRVFENAFPIVKPENTRIYGDFKVKPAFGYHEIIVESPDHYSTFEDFDHVKNTIITYIQRFEELSKRKGIKHISIFKNYGKNAGASLHHPHSQVMAINFIPDEIKKEMKKIKLMKKIISIESKSKRFIFESNEFISFAPFFSESPYEVWIVPKVKKKNISYLSKREIFDLSSIIQKIIKSMKSLLGDFSYNLIVKQLIKGDYYMRIEIRPRLETPGGFEIDTDAIVNTAIPEKVAELLRDSIKRI